MLILGIDTATMTLSLALVRRDASGRDEVLSEKNFPPPAQHSMLLPGEIGKLLEQTGHALDHVDAMVVGLGPGSFTGLRVGLATARAICFARHIPLVGTSSLHAMAIGALQQRRDLVPGDLLVPLFDARKGEVYGGFYRVNASGALNVESLEFVCPPEALAEKLASEKQVKLFGPGRQAYALLHSFPRLDSTRDPTPSAAALIGVAREIQTGMDWEEFKKTADALEPHYVRSSDHEWKMVYPN